jgi:hypothetical protein
LTKSNKRIGLTPVELREIFPSPPSKEYPTIGVTQPAYIYATATKPEFKYGGKKR